MIADGFAQIGSGYSRYGIGDVLVSPSVRRNGFGGLGLASTDQFDVNSLNPAAWNGIRSVKILASMRYFTNNYSDGINSNFSASSSFESVALSIPLSNDNGIGFVIGATPYSKVNYDVINYNLIDSIGFKAQYSGDGGLNKIYFGTSYKFPFDLSIGLSADYLVGTINHRASIDIGKIDFVNSGFVNEYRLRGFSFTFGTISPNLESSLKFGLFEDLRVGVSYSTGARLKTESRNLKYGTTEDTLMVNNYITEIPFRFGFGLEAQFSERFRAYVDYLFQDWLKYRTNNQQDFNLATLSKTVFGVEYLPTAKPESFLQTFALRFGLFLRNSEFKIRGEKINEFGINFGFSFPFDQINLIDFALEYSIRGKSENHLQKDNMFKLWVGINFAEFWFMKSED
jgi:hypothetical protein